MRPPNRGRGSGGPGIRGRPGSGRLGNGRPGGGRPGGGRLGGGRPGRRGISRGGSRRPGPGRGPRRRPRSGRLRSRGRPRPIGRAVPPGTSNTTTATPNIGAVTPNPSAPNLPAAVLNGSSRSGVFKIPDEIVEELDLTRRKRQARRPRRFRNYEANYDVSQNIYYFLKPFRTFHI